MEQPHNHSCSRCDGRKTLQPLKAILAEETDVDLSKNRGEKKKVKSLIIYCIIFPLAACSCVVVLFASDP